MRNYVRRLGAAPRERAQQLLYFCLVNKLNLANPREFEQEFHQCVQVFSVGGPHDISRVLAGARLRPVRIQ